MASPSQTSHIVSFTKTLLIITDPSIFNDFRLLVRLLSGTRKRMIRRATLPIFALALLTALNFLNYIDR